MSDKGTVMGRRALSSLIVPLLLIACDGSSPGISDGGVDGGDGRIGQCAPGLKPYGPACIPIFDDYCKDDEVPLLGGGCKKVGVEECTPTGGGMGIKGPPDWTCKPIGPPMICSEGRGICEPVLPKDSCPAGTMEVIGESECQPIGDCGTGTWGDIKIDAKTVFVDVGHVGGCDGSQLKPYRSISEAVQAALGGGQVAIAAGVYEENILLDRALTLVGRCPTMTRIVGKMKDVDGALQVTAAGVVIRGLTVSGPVAGVLVASKASATVEQAIIEKCPTGVSLQSGAKAVLRNVLVDRAGGMMHGLRVVGADVTVEQSTIRDLQDHPDGAPKGSSEDTGISAVEAYVLLRDSVLARNRGGGIRARSTTVTLERCVVLDSEASVLPDGPGIVLDGRWGARATLAVRDTLLAGNRGRGVLLYSTDATLERSVVRGTRPHEWGNWAGQGVGVVAYGQMGSGPSQLTLRDSVVARNVSGGMSLWGSRGVVERAVVSDTLPMKGPVTNGGGLWAFQNGGLPGEMIVRDSLIARNAAGIFLGEAQATIERSVVRDSACADCLGPLRDAPEDVIFGNGITAGICTGHGTGGETPSSFVLRDVVLARNRYVGVSSFCSQGILERVAIRDTGPAPGVDRSGGWGVVASSSPGEGGTCAAAPSLLMRECLIEGNAGSGVWLEVAEAAVERAAVRGTSSLQAKEYGDGMTLFSGLLGAAPRAESTLRLLDSLVEGNARAGAVFYGGGGSVRRTVFRGNIMPLDLEEAAAPEIGDDNVYEGNVENRVTWGNNLAPSPPPKMPLPLP